MALDLSFKPLIDAAEDGAAIGQPICVAIDRIDEDPDQPRRSFDEQKLEELAESVRQYGVLQPIVLRQATEEVRAEWTMICTVHNLLKLFNLANAA
ncbi:ParB N-terminal domain-containing protein [Bradyrhizobium sp. 2S1]|uniref:ParB N-terminal domain-containing protein n=1 Tax=Bradyrhizobium sp. 2S1 TaxID=1404429 RepID=UPI001CD0D39B|nr:ParB N-terminal domain-containing protein [Bradyrhizobium sp. 2S1]MCK7664665.1 ParB N-terminal domain-containing protein [Bradyrhizobium sp. 2S1]